MSSARKSGPSTPSSIPAHLAAHHIGIDEVEQALAQHNVNLPVGTLWGNEQAMTLKASGQLLTAPAFGQMIVAYRNGSPVRLAELGQVVDGVQNDKSAVWLVDAAGSARAIGLSIQRQPGTNTVEVVQRIKALLPSFREQIPPSVKVTILLDRSEPILDSFNDVKFTLGLAVAMVVLVIFLFLRNVSATLIPSLALPISIIGTFAAMNLLGYTLDNLSLMALTLSVGFVVDDAIVVLENIVRHLEMGQSRMLAAIEGAREIGFTVLSMTLSLAAVFIPVLFMSGIMGRLFHEFAVTIMVAILISGFVSISLTPMLCSRFLRPPSDQHNAVYRASEKSARRDAFRVCVGAARRHAASLPHHVRRGRDAGGDHLPGRLVPKGFIPSQDIRQLQGNTEARQDISFDSMARLQQQAAAAVASDPNIEAFISFMGTGNQQASVNQGRFFRPLKASHRAETDAGAGHRGTSPQAGRGGGHAHVPHESAAGAHRRQPEPQPVPIHIAIARPRCAVPRNRGVRKTHAGAAGPFRRE